MRNSRQQSSSFHVRQQGERNPSSRSSSLESESGDEFQPGAPQTVTVATQAEGKSKDILDQFIELFEVDYKRYKQGSICNENDTKIDEMMVELLETSYLKKFINKFKEEYKRILNDSKNTGSHCKKLEAMKTVASEIVDVVYHGVVSARVHEGKKLSTENIYYICLQIWEKIQPVCKMKRRETFFDFGKSDFYNNMSKVFNEIARNHKKSAKDNKTPTSSNLTH
ncbi:hypothetical protein [Candidiatus Paracoxiella cheracis]|uniref:hypothetical protein n=1 Tax=Candidiatus Paracoxiella cheracis TaxID=3405120 RepID=UPI003BF6053D